ncbi:Na(+)/H(+) antiporter subunit C [Schaalia canis]|uniref:Na(+)/H(+) antiporter subunit C n=1 Tax=Schaalia canis TaxID=100469 RepID=A0A3P1SFP7_9ACTO|nr:Na(+)/H(+) antiporter subunit C [Schaalia canis]RRC95826.1 Na(+)/H(+) antiporter subunit C [Schaalia canis]
MTAPSVTVLLIAAALAGTGVYLMLERSLSRIFIGLGLITHAVNVLLLAAGGAAGRPPLIGEETVESMGDPLPQAMMLTSIVLSLGTTAFGLALAYRSWRLTGHDEVIDDIEDRILSRRADDEVVSYIDEGATGDEDGDINYDDGDDQPHSEEPDSEEPRSGEPAPAEGNSGSVDESAVASSITTNSDRGQA